MATKALAPPWRSRIVGEGEEAPDQLLANPLNWRIHPKTQQEALAGVLSEVGWIQRVIVNQRTGHVVDGHARIGLAISRGEPSVPVLYVDLAPDEEAKVLATLDPISAMAGADKDVLNQLLREVSTGDAAVQALLEDVAKGAGLGYGVNGLLAGEAPEPEIDRAAELQVKWGVRRGDAWEIGRHRLLCGDATNAEDVARLMAGERYEMVWTDPPYGVAVGDKNKYLNSIARSNRVEENLAGDTLDEAGVERLWSTAVDVALAHGTAGAAWYAAAPPGPLHLVFGLVLHRRGIYRQTLIWVKQNATFAPLGVDYHWRHEPIFYGWIPTGAHHAYGGRQQDTVWNIDRPMASPEHPTMKPVALVARALENSSRHDDVVYDPFLGSGTTAVAAEQLGRRCFALELEPKYVAVTLERMRAMGLAPRRVEAGED